MSSIVRLKISRLVFFALSLDDGKLIVNDGSFSSICLKSMTKLSEFRDRQLA